MKDFLLKCLEAGNVILHLILGSGITMLFLKYERHFFLQLVISGLLSFGAVFIGEFLLKIFFKAKPNIYDAVNSSIAGLITCIIYLSIYGWKFSNDIDVNQTPKMLWYYLGWVLIGASTSIWITKQVLKKINI